MRMLSAIICCDASSLQGLGHLQRCKVLAQVIMARGGQAHILCINQGNDDFSATVAGISFTTVSLDCEFTSIATLVREQQANLLIVDHYRADPAYQERLKGFGLPWLQFDYRHAFDFQARWVVNINPFATPDDYKGLCTADTRLLLGPQYAILRPEFASAPRDSRAELTNVLVMLGGGDDRGVAEALINWLSARNLNVFLVTTRINPRLLALQQLAQCREGISVLVEPADIAGLMRSADLAISAGGTTTFELVSQHVPFLSIALADNQVALCRAWEELGVSLHLGSHAGLTEASFNEQWARIEPRHERARMSEYGIAFCDNAGAERIVKEIETWN